MGRGSGGFWVLLVPHGQAVMARLELSSVEMISHGKTRVLSHQLNTRQTDVEAHG